MKLLSSRRARAATLVLLAAGSTSGTLLLSTTAAGAASKTITVSCPDSALINDDGSTGEVLLPDAPPFDLATDVPTVTSDAVSPGSSFDAHAPSATIHVPATIETLPGLFVDVFEAKNIKLEIKVTGAASIGTPTLSGGTATNATVVKQSADTILLTMPGNKTGSTIPAGDLYFSGDSTFTSPALTLPVTAPNAGGDITFTVSHFQTDSGILLGQVPPALPARASCTPKGDTSIGHITVKDPRAPLANDDTASTTPGKAVDIDVLANDGKNSLGQDPDPASLEVTTNPSHGTAAVNDDGTITYTPTAGFQGSDTFVYQVCDTVEQQIEAAENVFCDTATVTVNVGTVGGQGSTTPTTVAAAAELPRTGSSSLPLGVAGFAMCALGFAVLRVTRRRFGTEVR